MNIGSNVNDLGLMILLLIPGLLGPMLLLGVCVLLARVMRFPPIVGVLFPIVVLLGALLGASLYLDNAGQTITGQVQQKQESVRIREQGDWRHRLSVTVRYRHDGSTLAGDQITPDTDSSTGLGLPAIFFDQLRENEPVALRIVPLWRSLTLVRLANTSTYDFVPWNLLAIGGAVIGFGVLVWLFGRTTKGCLLFVVLGFMAFAGGIGLNVYQQWQTLENLAAKPLRATVTVDTVQRITQVDLLDCEKNCSQRSNTEIDALQPYDIITMRFTPEGGRAAVIAVGSADAGSINVQPGDTVTIAYAADNVRAAQIIGATHEHYWKNILGYGLWLALGLILALVLVGMVGQVAKKRKAQQPAKV
jgi:hypothetical protein